VLQTGPATSWQEESGFQRSKRNRIGVSHNTPRQHNAHFVGLSILGVCCSGLGFSLLLRPALKEPTRRCKIRTLASQKTTVGETEAHTGEIVYGPVNLSSLISTQEAWSWSGPVGNRDKDDNMEQSGNVASHDLEAVPPWFRGNGPCKLVYAAKEKIGKPLGEALGRSSARKDCPGSVESNLAILSVFDVGGVLTEEQRQEVRAMCQGAVDGMWHISLKVFGHTYDNVRMVDGLLPRQLAPELRYQYTLSTERTSAEWDDFWADLKKQPRWNLDSYNMRENNCNHFQAETVGFLVPDEQVDLVTAEQVLSPLDFGLKEPPKKLHRYANVALMRGLLRRRVENELATMLPVQVAT